MVNEKRLVSEFMELVSIDSITKKEGDVAKVITKKLEALGAEVYIDKAGEKVGSNTGNIIAKIKGNLDKPAILFSAHMDTVVPGEGVRPIIKDGIIYSETETILGADDKGGIAAILEGIRVVKENGIPHGDIEVVFTIAEEGGLFGAKNLEHEKLTAKMGYVLDSDGKPGTIVVKGPAQDKIDVIIKGKAAHAGVSPEEGVSAIIIASKAIAEMKLLRIDEDTTANIGVISGGTATNIVTDKVEIKGEARSTVEEKLNLQTKHMVESFERAARELGGEAIITTERVYSAFNLTENDPVVQNAIKAAENLGFNVVLKATGGGSDTNILNTYGIPTVNLGIGMVKPHTTNEQISVEDLVNSAKYVTELIKTI
ncbi:peptidase T-like protein [Anaerobranca californiensis DSM 14826]|jgi:tripeptide aminopeptidase|uniref:Peptidase T-like protein n=1 Tax=Anaerobranca californiensis DSM 14826 TaxID=1120989 RepID=A0A1M6M415_9FIRM|nr:M20/M25/M40 family metallo-hydrolase [Anaerobranca californiensis]SHJ78199.1 peptidase T-like protein [Anaerobranca californiensis DSM 14826]